MCAAMWNHSFYTDPNQPAEALLKQTQRLGFSEEAPTCLPMWADLTAGHRECRMGLGQENHPLCFSGSLVNWLFWVIFLHIFGELEVRQGSEVMNKP